MNSDEKIQLLVEKWLAVELKSLAIIRAHNARDYTQFLVRWFGNN